MKTSSRSALVAAAIAVIVHAALGLSLIYVMIFVIPGYKKQFKEYQVELPAITRSTVEISDWMVNYWYVFALVAMPALVVDAALVFLTWRGETRVVAGCWIMLMALLLLLVIGPLAAGIWVAHAKLMEGLAR
jgi:type II secretory pathway component PulF